MSKFYETSGYLKQKLALAEKEVANLKHQIEQAQVREFYWHLTNALTRCDTENEWERFYESNFTITFQDKTVTLYNGAQIFQDIQSALECYMDEDNIEYKEEKPCTE